MSEPIPLDPAMRDVTARLLAYLHPLFMIITVGLLALVFKEGVTLRRARLKQGVSSKNRSLHTRLAKLTTGLLLAGAISGPISSVWLRGWSAFESIHARITLSVLCLCLLTAILGRLLERHQFRRPDIHGWLGLATLLGAVAAFVTGFALLP
jgi:hypothetical protein